MNACDYLEKEVKIIAEILAEEDVIHDSEDHDLDLKEEIHSVYGVMKSRVNKLFHLFVKKNGLCFKELIDLEKKILVLVFRTKLFSLQVGAASDNRTSCEQVIDIDNFKKELLKEKTIFFEDDFRLNEPRNPIVLISHCLREEVNYFFQEQLRKLGIERVFVAGGGTEVFQIIEEENPDLVIGVACRKEVEDALEVIKVPALGICIDVQGRCSQKKNLI